MKAEVHAVGENRGVLHGIGFREFNRRWSEGERDQ